MSQGINITGLSTSAQSLWKECEQKYFITYGLRFRDDGNLKTVLGSVTHKVLEILAKAKKSLDSGSKIVNDEILGGDFSIDMQHWMKPKKLSSVELESINKTRQDKKIYLDQIFLSDGHIRRGEEFVNYIISLAYAWYSNKYDKFDWDTNAFHCVSNWTWMALEYKDGLYDPRTKKIVATEFSFEKEIIADWAHYEYNMPDGQKKEGFLKIRGVIDLVIDSGDGIYEILDWKTGQRKDWATGKIKDFDSLQKDDQLMMYYYASRLLLKEARDTFLTIFFIRHGGPFTLSFDNSAILKVEKKIYQDFTNIKKCKKPKLLSNSQSHFKCKYFCPFFKLTKNNKNLCSYVHEEIKTKGIEQVQKDFFEENKKNELSTTKV